MRRTVTYTVLITKHRTTFTAECPALIDCTTRAKSRSAAYRAVKDLIRRHLTKLIEDDKQPPTDPLVSVKHLRINLQELRKEVNLQ